MELPDTEAIKMPGLEVRCVVVCCGVVLYYIVLVRMKSGVKGWEMLVISPDV